MYISINGKVYPEKYAKISVQDHGVLLGDGLFETLRTYNGKLFKFDEHYKRLKDSAKHIYLPILIDKETLRKQIEFLIKKNNLKEARVRITVTRGIGHSGLSINCNNQSVIIIAEKLKEVNFDKGVNVISINLERALPSLKSLSYLPSIIAKEEAKKRQAYEAILIDSNGFVREGSFSNVFIVKDNVLLTPKENILKGITRKIVIDVAKKTKMIVKETEFKKEALINADEIFITFSTAGIVPVTAINNTKKSVGKITKKLMELYDKNVQH